MPGDWQVSGGVDHGRQARHEPATDGLAVCHGRERATATNPALHGFCAGRMQGVPRASVSSCALHHAAGGGGRAFEGSNSSSATLLWARRPRASFAQSRPCLRGRSHCAGCTRVPWTNERSALVLLGGVDNASRGVKACGGGRVSETSHCRTSRVAVSDRAFAPFTGSW